MHTFHDPALAKLAEVAASLDATMALPDGAASVFAAATRVAVLDQNGYPAVGAATYSTNQVIKASFAPVMETGDDLVQKNANGDIIWHFKHGDMPKYWDVTLEFATPDPTLEQIINGGTLLTDNSTALTAPSAAPTGTPSGTGGSLAAGSYYYRYTYGNQYGETTASASSTVVTVTGTGTGKVTLTLTAGSGNQYVRIYRTAAGGAAGTEQLLATIAAGTSFVDDGSYGTPVGSLPATNTTAGPGNAVGYQAPALGIVGNPNGFSFEFWSKAIVNGVQATYLPYYRWAIPLCRNFTQQQRDATDAGMQNVYKGQAFENPNWGTGPFGDWQWDSSKVFQRGRASALTLPATTGFASVPATV